MRVTNSGGRARVWGGNHQVSLNRVFARQRRTHGVTGRNNGAPRNTRVRASQVNILKYATSGGGGGETARSYAVGINSQKFARFNLTHIGGTHNIQGGSLGGHHPAALQASQHQRAHAVGVAGRIEGVFSHEGD